MKNTPGLRRKNPVPSAFLHAAIWAMTVTLIGMIIVQVAAYP